MRKITKQRKRTSGPIRDKERTKQKMIQAVGIVLEKKGYAGLNGMAVAKEAGVDKRLVWTYFGSLDNLVEQYLMERDFLKFTAQESIKLITETSDDITKDDIFKILHERFRALLKDDALKRIILWELSESKDFLTKLSSQREEVGEQFFSRLEKQFNAPTKKLRSIMALLIGGIYYISLHSKVNGKLLCGLDINKAKDKVLIEQSINDIIAFAFNNK